MGALPQKIFVLNCVKSCKFRQNKNENALSSDRVYISGRFRGDPLNLEEIRIFQISMKIYVKYWRATPSPTHQISPIPPLTNLTGSGPPSPSESAHSVFI